MIVYCLKLAHTQYNEGMNMFIPMWLLIVIVVLIIDGSL